MGYRRSPRLGYVAFLELKEWARIYENVHISKCGLCEIESTVGPSAAAQSYKRRYPLLRDTGHRCCELTVIYTDASKRTRVEDVGRSEGVVGCARQREVDG